MTNWQPDLSGFDGPRYQAIAEAIATDLRQGRLKAGERLPTHRELAYRLGVTVGTVTRGYAEAQRRGLVAGHVGRGSFLAGPGQASAQLGSLQQAADDAIELSLAFPPPHFGDALFQRTLGELARDGGIGSLLDYQPHGGMAHHRAAGAAWIARHGLSVAPEQVLITLGAQHAISVVLRGLTKPGDLLLTESLTYSGIKATAAALNLRLRGLPMDDEGLLPDGLEAACSTERAGALFCMPNLQNPTGAIMSPARREAIAAIALKHRLPVIEDDVYGFLAGERPTLTELLPDLGHYVVGTSKSMAPGLRVGFLALPKGRDAAFLAAFRATIWMAPPLTAEIVTRWIVDGAADTLAEAQRSATVERQALTARLLEGFDYRAHPSSFFGLLHMPAPWRANDLVAAAARRGLRLRGAEVFATDLPPPEAIRLCVSAVSSAEQLGEGLARLVSLLREGPASDGLVV
jgi:DNA-binding transcriptional MocR family regulator